jgi:superfamily II DNA helicase RecQ
MLTASGLSVGADFPKVQAILHVCTPHTLSDFARRLGRAGRQGQRDFPMSYVTSAGRFRAGSPTYQHI